jgi:hypothetical protein
VLLLSSKQVRRFDNDSVSYLDAPTSSRQFWAEKEESAYGGRE